MLMRRSDREVTDIDQIMEIVDQARILHLGMFAEGYPYVVPLHYGYEYENGVLTFYLHSAGEGRKLDLIRANPNVCVELEANVELVSGHDIPCRYGAAFSSVIGTGKAEIVCEEQEKIKGLKLLMVHQTGREFDMNETMAAGVAVLKVTVTDFTAKKKS